MRKLFLSGAGNERKNLNELLVAKGTKIMIMEDAVVQLHYLASQVEQEIGSGQLSEDLRKCADRLHELIKPVYVEKTAK
jgi:hypothetical protein